MGNFCPCRRHAGFLDGGANQLQDFRLAFGQCCHSFAPVGRTVDIHRYCEYIQLQTLSCKYRGKFMTGTKKPARGRLLYRSGKAQPRESINSATPLVNPFSDRGIATPRRCMSKNVTFASAAFLKASMNGCSITT